MEEDERDESADGSENFDAEEEDGVASNLGDVG